MARRRTTPAALASPSLVISKREAARLLGIDRGGTLGALLAAGLLRQVPWGKSTRIPFAEVERLASQGFKLPAKALKARGVGRAGRRADAEELRHLDLDTLVVPTVGSP